MQAIENNLQQAEQYIVEMDAVQQELEATGDYDIFESCKVSLALLKSKIEALGYGVERCVNGWRLVQPVVEEVAQVATSSAVELHEDEQGLYAEVVSSTGKTSYRVGVCAKWLKTVSCTCRKGQFGQDCPHQVQIDEQLRDIRPTFSQWIAGEGANPETINALLSRDRYAKPLNGSGMTGFRAAEIAQKLAA